MWVAYVDNHVTHAGWWMWFVNMYQHMLITMWPTHLGQDDSFFKRPYAQMMTSAGWVGVVAIHYYDTYVSINVHRYGSYYEIWILNPQWPVWNLNLESLVRLGAWIRNPWPPSSRALILSVPCVCPFQRFSRESTDKQRDGRTDRRYQVHYLPASLSYVVDKNWNGLTFVNEQSVIRMLQLNIA